MGYLLIETGDRLVDELGNPLTDPGLEPSQHYGSWDSPFD
jgi:hypothetical protein